MWLKRLLSYIFFILASLNIGIRFRVCLYIYIYRERERAFWVFWVYKIGPKYPFLYKPKNIILYSLHPNVGQTQRKYVASVKFFFSRHCCSEWIFLLWSFPAEGKLIRWVLFMYLSFGWMTSWVVWAYSLVYIFYQ